MRDNRSEEYWLLLLAISALPFLAVLILLLS